MVDGKDSRSTRGSMGEPAAGHRHEGEPHHVWFSAAPHLRRAMQPDQVTYPWDHRAQTRTAGREGIRPACPVRRRGRDPVTRGRHAQGQETLSARSGADDRPRPGRPGPGGGRLPHTHQWGTGLTLAILLGAAILAWVVPFVPVLDGRGHGRRGGPGRPRHRLYGPTSSSHGPAGGGPCSGIYLLDVLLAIYHVRRLFRQQSPWPRSRAPEPEPKRDFRMLGETRNGGGGTATGTTGMATRPTTGTATTETETAAPKTAAMATVYGNGNGSHEPDQDVPGHGSAIPSLREPERVYYGRNGIIGWGVPLRAFPLTIQSGQATESREREIGSFQAPRI